MLSEKGFYIDYQERLSQSIVDYQIEEMAADTEAKEVFKEALMLKYNLDKRKAGELMRDIINKYKEM